MEDDDKKTTFYTGLPSHFLFAVILKFIEPCMKSTSTITIAEQLFSVLAKLRLNLKDKDVADRPAQVKLR